MRYVKLCMGIITIVMSIVLLSLLTTNDVDALNCIYDDSEPKQGLWQCSGDLAIEKGLLIEDIEHRKGLDNSWETVSESEATPWVNFEPTMKDMDEYNYGGSYGYMLTSPGAVPTNNGLGQRSIYAVLHGVTPDGRNFSVTQSFTYSETGTVYASWYDLINFSAEDAPSSSWWVLFHHRSEAKVVDTSNDVYVWRHQGSDGWTQLHNEIAIDAHTVTANGYSCKVHSSDDDIIHYEPMFTSYDEIWNINRNSLGFTDAPPYLADDGGDPSETRIDVWLIWRDNFTSQTAANGFYFKPSTWPD